MTRKQFIKSHGGTCRNWTWSWSFINEPPKLIIFGEWDTTQEGNAALILDQAWEISRRGRKQPGYYQARDHIRLVEEEGYHLMTFPMVYSNSNEGDGEGPAKIAGFTAQLSLKYVVRVGSRWYASDQPAVMRLPEELTPDEALKEGASQVVSVNAYERNPTARARCLAHYGYKCAVCSFDFERSYGLIGRGYIHVHHIIPLSSIGREYIVDPIKDLVPICPNCHAMIHRRSPSSTLSIKDLLAQLQKH